MPKRKKPDPSQPSRPLLPNPVQVSIEEFNIPKEADSIVEHAQAHEGRIVRIDELVFFSTDTGDAWMLDVTDNLALCLAQAGAKQPFIIRQTATTYGIEWSAHFKVIGDQFVVTEHSGRARTILGYPIQQLSQTIKRRQ